MQPFCCYCPYSCFYLCLVVCWFSFCVRATERESEIANGRKWSEFGRFGWDCEFGMLQMVASEYTEFAPNHPPKTFISPDDGEAVIEFQLTTFITSNFALMFLLCHWNGSHSSGCNFTEMSISYRNLLQVNGLFALSAIFIMAFFLKTFGRIVIRYVLLKIAYKTRIERDSENCSII